MEGWGKGNLQRPEGRGGGWERGLVPDNAAELSVRSQGTPLAGRN